MDEDSMNSAKQVVLKGLLSYRKVVDKNNVKAPTLESSVKNWVLND